MVLALTISIPRGTSQKISRFTQRAIRAVVADRRLGSEKSLCKRHIACLGSLEKESYRCKLDEGEVVGGELVVRFCLRSVETHCRSATGDRSRSRASTSARPRLI